MTTTDLNGEEQKALLALARTTIRNALENKEGTEQPLAKAAAGDRECGAFVSLHIRGMLRGCIGTFTANQPLSETIKEMALAAAFRDPRFPPLTIDELPELEIEISVLCPLTPVSDIEEIEIGRHGVQITRGMARGVLLPQVATQQRWDRETFLRHCCLKACLPVDSWRDKKTKLEKFTAQIFGDAELKR